MGSGADLGGPGRLLGSSWAGTGLLLGILVGSWQTLGLSLATLGAPGRLLGESSASPGLLLGVLVGSWTALGLSWATLGRS